MTLEKDKVAVLGAGSFGTTLAHVIADAGRPVFLCLIVARSIA